MEELQRPPGPCERCGGWTIGAVNDLFQHRVSETSPDTGWYIIYGFKLEVSSPAASSIDLSNRGTIPNLVCAWAWIRASSAPETNTKMFRWRLNAFN